MTSDEPTLRTLHTAWVAAVNAGDLPGLPARDAHTLTPMAS